MTAALLMDFAHGKRSARTIEPKGNCTPDTRRAPDVGTALASLWA
jgi:hypothetical protein